MTLEDAEDQPRPELTHKNRLAMFPMRVEPADKITEIKLEIMQSAHEATSILDLQILHAKMDSLLSDEDGT